MNPRLACGTLCFYVLLSCALSMKRHPREERKETEEEKKCHKPQHTHACIYALLMASECTWYERSPCPRLICYPSTNNSVAHLRIGSFSTLSSRKLVALSACFQPSCGTFESFISGSAQCLEIRKPFGLQ